MKNIKKFEQKMIFGSIVFRFGQLHGGNSPPEPPVQCVKVSERVRVKRVGESESQSV